MGQGRLEADVKDGLLQTLNFVGGRIGSLFGLIGGLASVDECGDVDGSVESKVCV